jgi:2-dehydropantoate 2-reductase
MNNPVLIMGTGAMACLFGARLAKIGVQVTMLGTWSEGLDALRSRGIGVKVDGGPQQEYRVQATADPADCAGARLALVLVKSWQTERAARQLAACLSPHGIALTLQNGLGNLQALEAALGKSRVALGVSTLGATLVAPGYVRPGGDGTVYLGNHPRLDTLAVLLQQAGFTLEMVPQADDVLWSKLVINAAINPLTALLRVQNGELLARPSARSLMDEIAREAGAVAIALGRHLNYADPIGATRAVARRTATNHSSMLQDVQRGAPTEIDAICGAIVAAGRDCGVPTPANRTLWLLVKALKEA